MRPFAKTPVRPLLAVTALFLALGLAPRADAVVITATDYDSIGAVGALFDSVTATMFGPGSADFGQLTTNVYFDGSSTYTYENILTPNVNSISEFVTAFPVVGFNGTVGWSFSQADAAGGDGNSGDFLIDQDLIDMTIDWETSGAGFAADGFGAGETITFFFQSSAPPGPNIYSQIDGGTANATTLGPVPEPGTVLLLGSALFGLGLIRRKRKS